jgi:hypothetical protein
MIANTQPHLQKVVQFLHHSPMAMAEISMQGVIRQLNPKCVQLMMPLAMHLGLPGDNLLDVLTGFLPSVRQAIDQFDAHSGLIISQEPYRVEFAVQQVTFERHFSLTINKLTPESLLVFFEDVTDFLIKADALRQQP